MKVPGITFVHRRDFSVRFNDIADGKMALLILLINLKVIHYKTYASNSHLHFVELP